MDAKPHFGTGYRLAPCLYRSGWLYRRYQGTFLDVTDAKSYSYYCWVNLLLVKAFQL